MKATWIVKVVMPWNLHDVLYGRRNILGGIVFEFERKNLHFFKVRNDLSMWCGLRHYQRMEVKEVQPPILHAQ